MVEHQPSKLRVAGSNPVARFRARVAQSVERILGKDEVTGSNPVASLVVGHRGGAVRSGAGQLDTYKEYRTNGQAKV